MTRTVDARSVEELTDALRRGDEARYLFFWGHRPPRGGGVGPSCLSQWWPAEFVVDGVRYRTAEHYMMARKAALFGDDAAAARVVEAEHPAEAKKIGRLVRGFDEKVWADHRFDIVVEGNLAKFSQHPQLRDFLLGTRDRVLVEASPLDRVWGIGLAADDERAGRPEAWRGPNLLGFALMAVRVLL
ncbi:hypothetical protein LX15_006228 [Streptoalloteichus tenebrarius]|uniref:NADAR domain-containing protein n=1 Tax=Streptoalloteichus tenebrarius (strain ATCC 17920 / DSM 40477 / JCM 4838 / CBS 697.72 / NBRC 16177 / NCIMB 11028 / NRRL B-12390 / A12253. 1 / ISP 5477) TaxID=1933 RepID=A0ABT1I400_STRSD|nr:NADAR family protein [Streptoalloteichus tenebrarius]MCP2262489.1 hypothetical protein [Streptoalloteichus tenebrarius]BFF01542.1 NADAR family protein [Streptoalloteichus tenebrarius]